MDISVIIPIYNVEKYIERCLRSLFTQTKTDGVEFILVNNNTPDNSMNIAQQIVSEYPNIEIKIINNEENIGVALSRKKGIESAVGEYTIMVDSDDWCESTMLEELYKKAVETDADIVIYDSIWDYGHKKVYWHEALPKDKNELWYIYFVEEKLHTFWSKLVKRSLYDQKEEFFIKGINSSDDFIASCKLFHYAKCLAYIPQAYLHYDCTNVLALSNKRNSLDYTLQRYNALVELENFLVKQGYDSSVIELMNGIKLRTKLALITLTRGDLQKKYARLWTETNKSIFCSKYHLHTKLIIWFASVGLLPLSNLVLLLVKQYKRK